MNIELKPYSALILSLSGFILTGMGLYFIFVRPPLLPEDFRYMGLTSRNVDNNMPGILNWLQKVFWVMGSYIFTAGVFTIYISRTSFLTRLPASFIIITLTWISSIGAMTVVNFIIASDFKWLLLLFNLPWVTALILYRFHK